MSAHQKILTLLAGASSQKPMAFDALVKASGLLPASLEVLLEQMAHATPMAINRATVTKDGSTQMMIWPTGAIHGSGRQMLVINHNHMLQARAARQQPTAVQVKPATAQVQPAVSTIPSKEIPMGAAPSKLNTTIYNRIAEQPGIGRDELVRFALQQCPGATEKQAKKAILNLVHSSGKTRSEGPRGKPAYYTAEFDERPAAPVLTAAKQAKPDADSFSIMLSENSCLHVCSGEQKMVFSKAQTERLWSFIGRVNLAVAA